MENRIEGYTVLTNTISGYELMWRVEGSEGREGETMPEVFQSERDAQLSILDDLIDELNQFNEGDREWDEIIWPGNEYMVCCISIDTNGTLLVWQKGYPDDLVINTTLNKWRKLF